MGPVSRGQERLFEENRSRKPYKGKSIDADAQRVVDFLEQKLGGTWDAALVPRAPQDSLLVNPPKSKRPWEEVARIIAAPGPDDYAEWVKGHLDSKVTWTM